MAVAVEKRPLCALHTLKIQPRRATQVAGVGHQSGPLKVVAKHLFAKGNRLVWVGLVQPVGQPGCLSALHNKGGGVFVKLVHVGLKPAVLSFLKQKSERVVELVRAQPNEAVGAHGDFGFEHLGVLAANTRIDAVAGNDQIGVRVISIGVGVGFKHQLDAQCFTAGLKNIEQLFAPNAHKTVATGANRLALEDQLDVIPVVEGLPNLSCGDRVLHLHVVHGGVREHHAPTKGVVRLVALHHGDVVGRVVLLHQQREIQARGAAANAHNLHRNSSSSGSCN